MPLLRRAWARRATWDAAVDRYRRAVDRYESSLREIPERRLRQELVHLGDPLEAVLEDFEDAADARSRYAREHAMRTLDAIHRAATLCAHAMEAALMAHEAARRHDSDDVARCLDAVRLLVKKIDELGDEVRPRA